MKEILTNNEEKMKIDTKVIAKQQMQIIDAVS